MKNYNILKINNEPRVELHESLNLTGAEISINNLAPNTNVPFVHAHKENEEIYIITSGSGYVEIDNEKVDVVANSAIKISPNAKRQFFAGSNGLSYICIQVKSNSLEQYTQTDAIIY